MVKATHQLMRGDMTWLLWRRFWLLLALSVLCIALIGCTTFGTPTQIENWPKLTLIEYRVSAEEANRICQPYAPAWGTAHACAIFYSAQCHVYAANEEYAVIERNNCRGLVFPFWQERAREIRDQINAMRTS